MPRHLAATTLAVALALLAVAGFAAPAWAHYPIPEEVFGPRPGAAAAATVEAPPPILSAAPDPGVSRWALVAAAAAACALAWRRPKRATAIALVFLLAV